MHVLFAVGFVVDAFGENGVFVFQFEELIFVSVDFGILGGNNILKVFHLELILLDLILHFLDGQDVQLILAIILSFEVVNFVLLFSEVVVQVFIFLAVLLLT